MVTGHADLVARASVIVGLSCFYIFGIIGSGRSRLDESLLNRCLVTVFIPAT